MHGQRMVCSMSPKARLEFNLPEEQDDYTLAIKAGEMYYMLNEIQNIMRQYRKYADFSSTLYTGKKRKSKSAGSAIDTFFNKLDEEILWALKNMPEVE